MIQNRPNKLIRTSLLHSSAIALTIMVCCASDRALHLVRARWAGWPLRTTFLRGDIFFGKESVFVTVLFVL